MPPGLVRRGSRTADTVASGATKGQGHADLASERWNVHTKCNPLGPIRVLVAEGWCEPMQTMANHGVPDVSVMQQRGDARDADFSAYMAARQPALLRTAYLLTGDRHGAEDLVQQTLAKLYVAWSKVQSQDSLDGYARRIMMNEHNSLWRRAWKRREVVTDTIPERGPGGGSEPLGAYPTRQADPAYDDGTRGALWAFVQTLPRKQRAVVVLRYYEELSEAETADVLGISVGTVKSQASRALAALRQRAPQALNPRHEGGN